MNTARQNIRTETDSTFHVCVQTNELFTTADETICFPETASVVRGPVGVYEIGTIDRGDEIYDYVLHIGSYDVDAFDELTESFMERDGITVKEYRALIERTVSHVGRKN